MAIEEYAAAHDAVGSAVERAERIVASWRDGLLTARERAEWLKEPMTS